MLSLGRRYYQFTVGDQIISSLLPLCSVQLRIQAVSQSGARATITGHAACLTNAVDTLPSRNFSMREYP